MKPVWSFEKAVCDGEEFKIKEINVWDFKWVETGEKIKINDPVYGKFYSLDVYKMQNDNVDVLFAAGEFSNCVWGIYLKGNNVAENGIN